MDITITGLQACADPETFVRGGQTLTFFNDWGIENPNTTRSGPLSSRQRNAIFKWRFACGPMMAQHWMLAYSRGSVQVLLRNPIFFVIFQGSPDPVTPLDPPMTSVRETNTQKMYFVHISSCCHKKKHVFVLKFFTCLNTLSMLFTNEKNRFG